MDEVWQVLHHPAGQLGTGLGLVAGLLLTTRGSLGKLFLWQGALLVLHITRPKIQS